MSIKRHIPNAITCGNLFCGCLAVVCAFKGDLVWSAYLVGIAAVLDFFDGFVARLLKVGGELGKQLDSLADMVTFGLVPGVVMYQLIKDALAIEADIEQRFVKLTGGTGLVNSPSELVCYVAFVIVIFSALRLAKFNIDTRQTDSFIGVPTPANAILICSLPLILSQVAPDVNVSSEPSLEQFGFFGAEGGLDAYTTWTSIIRSKYFLVTLTLMMSYLLVAELHLFALKFKNFAWKGNEIRYSFLIISVLLLILFQFVAIPFIIFLYISLSIINNVATKRRAKNI